MSYELLAYLSIAGKLEFAKPKVDQIEKDLQILAKECDEAYKIRDLARAASQRDLEAKRAIEEKLR